MLGKPERAPGRHPRTSSTAHVAMSLTNVFAGLSIPHSHVYPLQTGHIMRILSSLNSQRMRIMCPKGIIQPLDPHYTARNKTFNNLKLLEMGPLRFRQGELKVTFTRPLQLKGHLYER